MQSFNLRTDCTHGNPLVGARAWRNERRLHKQRLKAVVANVDNSKPFMDSIEQQQKKPRKSFQQRSKEKMQAHENFKMLTTIAATMNRPYNAGPRPLAPHSLNIGVRRREHWRILKENQQLLERLEGSKPLVSTAAQHRSDFLEHQRRLLMCSYSCRRREAARPATNKAAAVADKKPQPDTDSPKRHEGGTTPKHKLTTKCYKPAEVPHEAPLTPAGSPTSPRVASPSSGRRQFDQRWKEFRCYPASRQMWAPPKVFGPKDLPKPIAPAK